MEQGWNKIKTYQNLITAELDKQLLDENGIQAIILNKQDSSLMFGKIEIYVAEVNQEEALALFTLEEGEGE